MAPVVSSNFDEAHHFKIDKNTVINAGIYNQYQEPHTYNAALNALRNNMTAGALFDSADRCDAPKCHPATRVAIQQEIVSWAVLGNSEAPMENMLWLSGPAGGGKTAILGSISETCQDQGMLAASFFFSSFMGSGDRRYKKGLVATLAYQLIQHKGLQHLRPRILASIERNPAIFTQRLETQMQRLILNPLRKGPGKSDPALWPKVILIDGLDECQAEPQHVDPTPRSKEDEQDEILRVLMKATNDPAFPFRIVIASRPERPIRKFFEDTESHHFCPLVLDGKYSPDDDIALFIRSKLSEIRRRYNLPASWASEAVVQILVENASGQFIYAATVMRFLETPLKTPPELLDCVLSLRFSRNNNPFAPLDALYTHILSLSPNPVLSVKWLRAIDILLDARHSLHPADSDLDMVRRYTTSPKTRNALFIKQLLESKPGESEYLLCNLHSLLYVPPPEDSKSPYRFHHKSLLDFFNDPLRCGNLYVDYMAREEFYVACYIRILRAKGPTHLGTESEGAAFLRDFTRLRPPTFVGETYRAQLMSCDASWWVRTFNDRSMDSTPTHAWIHKSCKWHGHTSICRAWKRARTDVTGSVAIHPTIDTFPWAVGLR